MHSLSHAIAPFLKELPPELVEHSDAKSKTPVTAEAGKSLFAAMREAIGQPISQ